MSRVTAGAVLLILLLSVVLLAGCPKPAPTALPPVATAPGTPPTPPGQPAAPASVAKPEEAAKPAEGAAPSGDNAKALKAVGIEAYPGAEVVMSKLDAANGMDMVTVMTKDPIDKVVKFYKDKYGAKSDKTAGAVAIKGMETIAWTEGKTQFSVMIAKKPKTEEVGIVMFKKTAK